MPHYLFLGSVPPFLLFLRSVREILGLSLLCAMESFRRARGVEMLGEKIITFHVFSNSSQIYLYFRYNSGILYICDIKNTQKLALVRVGGEVWRGFGGCNGKSPTRCTQ